VLYQLSYLGQEFLPMRRYFTRMEHDCQASRFSGINGKSEPYFEFRFLFNDQVFDLDPDRLVGFQCPEPNLPIRGPGRELVVDP
jgi:hypothetical protein